MNNSSTRAVYRSEVLGEEYIEFTHASGLHVLVYPKKMSTSFALFGTKYGSIHNTFKTHEGELITVPDGIAHFLEHKLFVCEDGSDAFERFSSLGADANAYTSYNATAYYFTCSESFYDSLGELIDFVTHPYFTPESVESEMGIISEEIAMYEDNPYDRCISGMLEGMYHTHSIKKPISGTKQSIRQITAPLLYDCYNAFYRPDNMVLTVCGDIDPDELFEYVSAHLPDSFSGNAAIAVNEGEAEPSTVYREYTEQKMQISNTLFSIGFKDTSIPDSARERQKKYLMMSIINRMLFSSSEKFYTSLFERGIISPSLSYGYALTQSYAFTSIDGESDTPDAVLKELKEYIAEMLSRGLDRESFERTRIVLYSQAIRLFDSVDGIGTAMFSRFCSDDTMFGDAEFFSSVTYEEVQQLFEEFFGSCQITMSVVMPSEEQDNTKVKEVNL